MAKQYEVTILSAVDELQRMYRKLNSYYFNNELEKVIITIQTDVTRGSYAWISTQPVWSDKDNCNYREINIVAEYLNREPVLVIASLLHEMCHLFNLQRGVQDCSRSGTYHNTKFRDVANSHGLICTQSPNYGWCCTAPTPQLIAWVQDNCRKGCFRYQRQSMYSNGTPKKTTTGTDGRPVTTSRSKQSSRKYICPDCGLSVRGTKDLTGKLLCTACDKILIQA